MYKYLFERKHMNSPMFQGHRRASVAAFNEYFAFLVTPCSMVVAVDWT